MNKEIAAPAIGSNDEVTAWLEEFRAKHGRPPRILHIGNIANNAYLNAKLLNRAGLDCDVLCYDYYHIMGCPEWEEADFDSARLDHFRPDWTSVDLNGYQRPRWYVQGPLELCVKYLLARRSGRFREEKHLWISLAYINKTARAPRPDQEERWWVLAQAFRRRLRRASADPNAVARKVNELEQRLRSRMKSEWTARFIHIAFRCVCRICGPVYRRVLDLWRGVGRPHTAERGNYDFGERTQELQRLFRILFPERTDLLTAEDIMPYRGIIDLCACLFACYDVVQAYATDPILPMIARRPYVAFEHGTLRAFTMDALAVHRLTALAYRLANHVLITNGDCIDYAHRLGITRFSPMIHPVDIDQHRAVYDEGAAQIRERHGARCLMLCPLRHDWEVKGTDIHLRALPLIKRMVPGKVVLMLCRWGWDIDASEQLIEDLGCQGNVVWLEPLCRTRLIQHTRASDVVLDQMALPHFGATAPQALAVGTPVVMSYRLESTRWIVPEPAPILAAFTPEDVAAAVVKALDHEWRVSFQRAVLRWVDAYHHHRRVATDHMRIYREYVGTPLT
ncbi:MAG: glycosyltransferase [Gammaproteobacteria bacterium]